MFHSGVIPSFGSPPGYLFRMVVAETTIPLTPAAEATSPCTKST